MPNCLSQQITNRNDGDSLVIAHDRKMANAMLMHKSQTICEGMIDIGCHNVAGHDIGDRSCLWRLVGYDDSPDAIERCGLWCDDVEVLRLHYRYTVKHWRERFAKNRARAASIYDERFCRMWEFYLAAVELEFLHGSHMVFQLLLSTKRDAVPIMRDFMVDSERVAWTKLAG